MRRLALFIPLAAFALIGAVFAIGLTRDPARIPSALIDRPLPEFALPPIEGRTEGLSSEDFKGEVSLLNVFGSWCASCLIEHPTLMEIARSGDVAIYGLNWKDRPGDGAAWLARHGDPYRKIGDDPRGHVVVALGVTGAPETFVIDKEGRVRYKHVGPITPEAWRRTLAPLIEELKRT
jgi:cytochrome c biogenesis protein CcmG/thiol:disulfide interchange protein DsbE